MSFFKNVLVSLILFLALDSIWLKLVAGIHYDIRRQLAFT